MRANATIINNLLYTVETPASREQTQADMLVDDPSPERATAILKGAFPAPTRSETSSESKLSESVREEDDGPDQEKGDA